MLERYHDLRWMVEVLEDRGGSFRPTAAFYSRAEAKHHADEGRKARPGYQFRVIGRHDQLGWVDAD